MFSRWSVQICKRRNRSLFSWRAPNFKHREQGKASFLWKVPEYVKIWDASADDERTEKWGKAVVKSHTALNPLAFYAGFPALQLITYTEQTKLSQGAQKILKNRRKNVSNQMAQTKRTLLKTMQVKLTASTPQSNQDPHPGERMHTQITPIYTRKIKTLRTMNEHPWEDVIKTDAGFSYFVWDPSKLYPVCLILVAT